MAGELGFLLCEAGTGGGSSIRPVRLGEEGRKGRGVTWRQGFSFARSEFWRWMVMMDAQKLGYT